MTPVRIFLWDLSTQEEVPSLFALCVSSDVSQQFQATLKRFFSVRNLGEISSWTWNKKLTSKPIKFYHHNLWLNEVSANTKRGFILRLKTCASQKHELTVSERRSAWYSLMLHLCLESSFFFMSANAIVLVFFPVKNYTVFIAIFKVFEAPRALRCYNDEDICLNTDKKKHFPNW